MTGRPKKPKTEKKSTSLRIRLTDAESALLHEAARVSGYETSTWVRAEALRLAQQVLKKK